MGNETHFVMKTLKYFWQNYGSSRGKTMSKVTRCDLTNKVAALATLRFEITYFASGTTDRINILQPELDLFIQYVQCHGIAQCLEVFLKG